MRFARTMLAAAIALSLAACGGGGGSGGAAPTAPAQPVAGPYLPAVLVGEVATAVASRGETIVVRASLAPGATGVASSRAISARLSFPGN
jgi:hypothetical protein